MDWIDLSDPITCPVLADDVRKKIVIRLKKCNFYVCIGIGMKTPQTSIPMNGAFRIVS